MNIIMQLVKPDNGTRTEVFTGDRQQLAKLLSESEEVPGDALVLVLMEQHNDEWEFSNAPIFTKATFCSILEQSNA